MDGIERYNIVTWIRTGILPLGVLLLCLLMLSGCEQSSCGTHVINNLAGVFALSADDVWAVGGTTTDAGNYGAMTGLIEHWDGAHWSVVPNLDPDVAGLDGAPLSLTAVAGSAPMMCGQLAEARESRQIRSSSIGTVRVGRSSPMRAGLVARSSCPS